jgi:hypothetical protein
MDEKLKRFKYERGEGRHKHVWHRDEAGFVPSRRGPVGKCHCSITDEVAERLLHTGIVAPDVWVTPEYGAVWESDYPREIYNLYRGVPYVAVPTRPGISYHGYPHRGRLSASVRKALEERAREEGTLRVLRKWLREHEK